MKVGFNTPFAEQLEFFRQKLNLPTERWDDILRSAHDRAFIVAGAAKADLLADLHAAVDKTIGEGKSLGWFRKEFAAIVGKHGWQGWTGEGSPEGFAWRTRVIYQTNLATSYAAGRYRQLTDPDLLELRPYWRYKHADNVANPRLQHVAWNGLTLPHDHAFWKTHFPPNGWGCSCRAIPVDAREYAKSRAAGETDPPAGWDERDAQGNLPGIAKGFDYAPGANVKRPLKDLIDDKLIKLDAPIGAAMYEAMRPVLAMERQLAWWEALDAWLADEFSRGRVAIVGALSPATGEWIAARGLPIPLSAEIAVTDHLPRGAKQLRHEAAQNGLTVEEWRALPSLLEAPGAIYLDKHSGKLIFVAESIGPTKVAVEFNPVKLKKSALNLVETAFRVSDEAIAGAVKGHEWEIVEIPGRRVGVEPT